MPFEIYLGMNKLYSGTIAFIDSGIGGLPYYFWVKSRLSEARCIYVADTKHFPYGEKTEKDVQNSVLEIVQGLTKAYNPSLVVIACNTASVVTLKLLREHFDIPFVGVVPAIKPASERTTKNKIGVIATNRTVKDHYTAALINQFAGSCDVVSLAAPELVTYVEKEWVTSEKKKTEELVRRISAPFLQEEIDVLVLGCTHFLFLRDVFKKVLGNSIEIIDSLEGVGQQVLRVWQKAHGTKGEEKKDPGNKKEDIIHITGPASSKGVETCYNPIAWQDYFQRFFPETVEKAVFGGLLA